MRALLSVANREGVASLARQLRDLGIEMYATDGTRESLSAEGLEVRSISDLTSSETLAGGLVKTFHPEIYAGILRGGMRPTTCGASRSGASGSSIS